MSVQTDKRSPEVVTCEPLLLFFVYIETYPYICSMIQKGQKGAEVEQLQCSLTHYSLGANPVQVTGTFDDATHKALMAFQIGNGLVVDGIYGAKSKAKLDALTSNKFVISVHGGHGGLRADGSYATKPDTGKRYQHPTSELHTKDGWFYEGHENRVAANEVANQLRRMGVFVLVTHDEIECDYGKLSTHVKQTAPYIKLGYKGYTHAFHSNAAPSKIKGKDGAFIRNRTKAEMDAIRGGYVFTTKGNTFSDEVSALHLHHLYTKFESWVKLQTRGIIPTTASDNEENFQVLSDVEKSAAACKNYEFGAILEEFGFMTSENDCHFILDNWAGRVECAVKTALAVIQRHK